PRGVTIRVALSAQPKSTSTPSTTATVPAMTGTRSKKPFSGRGRLGGAAASVLVGLDMLRDDAKKPTGVRLRVQFYHAIALRSRKNPPVGPLSGRVASQSAVSAPFSTDRFAPRPPIAVRTHPGSTEFIRIPIPSLSAARTRVTTLIPAFDKR